MTKGATLPDHYLRSALRFALGVSASFVFAQLINYPLAYVLPVFVGILLKEPSPLPVRLAIHAIVSTALAIILGYCLAVLFVPYPIVFVAVFSLLLFRLYVFLLVSGAHFFATTGVLIGCLVMPVLIKVHPEVASGVGMAILWNVVLAVLLSWIAFVLIPVRGTTEPEPAKALPLSAAYPLALRFTMVAMPLFAAFLAFEWGNLLTLIFGVLYATAMNSRGGVEKGVEAMIANLILGGLTVFLVYEMLVMVPMLIMMALLLFAVSFFYGTRIVAGGRSAQIWWSGMSAMLFLAGPALVSEDVVVTAELLDRVLQILLAAVYITLAYSVMDLVQHYFVVCKMWLRKSPVKQ